VLNTVSCWTSGPSRLGSVEHCQGFTSGGSRNFHLRYYIQNGYRVIQPPSEWVPEVVFRGAGKRPERETDYSHLSNAVLLHTSSFISIQVVLLKHKEIYNFNLNYFFMPSYAVTRGLSISSGFHINSKFVTNIQFHYISCHQHFGCLHSAIRLSHSRCHISLGTNQTALTLWHQ
jgi:hypothetical protein